VTHDIDWKLVVEGFLEAYHLRSTHRDTFYPVAFDNLALHDHEGPHSRTIYPLRKITALSAVDPGGWMARPVLSFIYQLFPNTLLAVEPFHVAVIQVIPLGPGRSRIRTTALVSPSDRRHPAAVDADVAMLREGLAEDFVIGEEIQRGLRTRANEAVVFGLFEHTLTHFHEAIEAAIARGGAAARGDQ
jgi:phenylpropionate dioxygenase-like ring-hydroxylating dioxygenase large terminal subunit